MKTRCLASLFVLLASTLMLAQTNPVPLINQPLVPTSIALGGPSFTLVVNGTGFVPGSVVNWNGSPLTTVFINNSQLSATVPATAIAQAGTASITIVNPTPGEGTSNVDFLAVADPSTSLNFTQNSIDASWRWQAIVGDFNRDGKLDLVAIAEIIPSGNAMLVLLGNGDGSFQTPVEYPAGDTGLARPPAAAIGDFNRYSVAAST